MMLHFNDIVFGPIYSRRLGMSLGINILPSKGKLCNFDCIYCECGWNRDGIAERRFPVLAEVEAALTVKMEKLSSDGVKVDSITFSGNGEPTLNPDFPEAKISVLSNATLIGRPAVAAALKKIDNPILKIDASDDSLAAMINRPVGAYRLADVIKNLAGFDGNFILQTMFLKSKEFNAVSEKSLAAWMDIVRMLKPRQIMVYTIDRETPDKTLEKYTVEEMTGFVKPLIEEGFDVKISG